MSYNTCNLILFVVVISLPLNCGLGGLRRCKGAFTQDLMPWLRNVIIKTYHCSHPSTLLVHLVSKRLPCLHLLLHPLQLQLALTSLLPLRSPI
eukprot:10025401-Karenia_brevis.AAC.1